MLNQQKWKNTRLTDKKWWYNGDMMEISCSMMPCACLCLAVEMMVPNFSGW
jgi:hypothetical protein